MQFTAKLTADESTGFEQVGRSWCAKAVPVFTSSSQADPSLSISAARNPFPPPLNLAPQACLCAGLPPWTFSRRSPWRRFKESQSTARG